ncbi:MULTISPECIES: c-type cytochrome biogenesis protein CcsB [Micrococcaceae]|jgi:cytochrome c-type biogenesis protein CcsB|uniref:Cytochrome biogenesis protein n=3 Tax=Micrococcaceae TaxID=1268 RepID=Q6SK82_PAEAU|nr:MULTISPECIES: c-type cytochrome biogenesis protein CcsB [Micrococcaceae]AAS20090.1 cytochrome biogenesis protein [Paenarthrobacter aurescens]ABM10431.1 putative Cytochrome biogenesis protein [Paenarthrobacter aurescens TC1]SDQ03278.1 cytochrome c-type biogenesis protein CcsB [Arthrobacter crystallopoietes]
MTTVNETLGQYSELFMLLAALTYTVALMAFAADLVRARKITATAVAPAREPIPAAAGGTGAVRWSHESGKADDHGDGVVDDSMGYRSLRRPAARIGVAVSVLGLIIHAAGVISRGIAAGRVPWGNMYEFATTGAMLVMAVFLTGLLFRDLRFLGTFITGLALVMLMAGAVAFPTPVAQLIPALQSYWLVIHVSVAVLAAAIFTLTFALSVLQLAKARLDKADKPRAAGLLRLVPNPVSLEQLAYRLNAIGFILWTFTLMAGAIWAEAAWGRYWGWDTKEVWTFVIWVVYAGYLHARATRGWDGTRAAWLSITGYLCVIFNFVVVNVYFSGLHSYSGL